MTGILGGTFDPVHLGHLALAEEAAFRFGLERVLLVPCRNPPHKATASVSPFEARLAMLRLAVMDDPLLEAADLEPVRGPSYTCVLLRRLSGEGLSPVFVMGTDTLLELPSWMDYPRFLDMARFVAGTRPGFDPSRALPEVLRRVELFEMPGLHISSTDLRARFAASLPVRYLVPGAVRDYISRKGLYGCREGG